MQQKVKELSLEKIYLFPGHMDQVEDFFSVIQVFLMSSFNEGLGSSVLDAYFNKVPVVSTNAGGLADLVADGKAMIAEPGDASAMASAINFLLDHPESSTQQTEKAYRFVIAEHSLPSITDQYLSLFGQLSKQD